MQISCIVLLLQQEQRKQSQLTNKLRHPFLAKRMLII